MLDTQDCRNYIAGELLREVNRFISLQVPENQLTVLRVNEINQARSKSAEYSTILLALQSI